MKTVAGKLDMAGAGGGIAVSEGVVDVRSIRQTAENAARLNIEGMGDVDSTILKIITAR